MTDSELESKFSSLVLSNKLFSDGYFEPGSLLEMNITKDDARYRLNRLSELGYLRKEYFAMPQDSNKKKRFLRFYPSNIF